MCLWHGTLCRDPVPVSLQHQTSEQRHFSPSTQLNTSLCGNTSSKWRSRFWLRGHGGALGVQPSPAEPPSAVPPSSSASEISRVSVASAWNSQPSWALYAPTQSGLQQGRFALRAYVQSTTGSACTVTGSRGWRTGSGSNQLVPNQTDLLVLTNHPQVSVSLPLQLDSSPQPSADLP